MQADITLKRSTEYSDWVLLVQAMLNSLDFTKNGKLAEDGYYGVKTETKVKQFQNFKGLMADGIVGVQTFQVLIASSLNFAPELKRNAQKFLTEENIINAANYLEVDIATIKAVTEVESAGSGFVGNKPKILFEGHVFWKQLEKKGMHPDLYDGYEDVLYKSWTKDHYKGGLAEYGRLEKAKEIHPEAALESCSWGLFQIMGYHWQKLHYNTVDHFVECMHDSEGQQLFAFLRYVKEFGLVGYLQGENFESFSRAYNGPGYKANNYDTRLKNAYNKYSSN